MTDSQINQEREISILVVDDEESLRITFQHFLKREGYAVVDVASSYNEAFNLTDMKQYDCIITDIVLDANSGVELLREIRAKGITSPVIIITGYPNIRTASDAVRLGAFDYISKPVNKEMLLKVTRHAIAHRMLMLQKEKAEEENRRYRNFLEAIFRSVKDMIITVDPDLRVMEFNRAAMMFFKDISLDFDRGFYINALPGSLGANCLKDVEKVIATRRESSEHRIECTKPDGAIRFFRLSAAPLMDGSGVFFGAVMVLRELSFLEDMDDKSKRVRFHRFIGKSKVMQNVYSMIENVGKTDVTVLITGESGTGKELVAEALHIESHRSKRMFVKFDCTAIPEEIMESELFGHKKGAFTGATSDRMGRILKADGGTLFLDEIGDVSPKMQLRLLRFLQEKTFYPVGSDQPLQVDVRVIAATNADLKKRVQEGVFREDLYFRLRVVDIMLPPLRERKEDIELLLEYFLEKSNKEHARAITGFTDQALQAIKSYNWPGNVREFEHVVERACVLCQGNTITTEELPLDLIEVQHGQKSQPALIPANVPVQADMVEQHQQIFPVSDTSVDISGLSERDTIVATLRRTAGNKAKAARMLQIDRSTLYRKIMEYQLNSKEWET